MAIKSVATATNDGSHILPLAAVNEAQTLIYMARGIVEMIRHGGEHVDTDNALPGACWAVEEKLDRLRDIVSMRAP